MNSYWIDESIRGNTINRIWGLVSFGGLPLSVHRGSPITTATNHHSMLPANVGATRSWALFVASFFRPLSWSPESVIIRGRLWTNPERFRLDKKTNDAPKLHFGRQTSFSSKATPTYAFKDGTKPQVVSRRNTLWQQKLYACMYVYISICICRNPLGGVVFALLCYSSEICWIQHGEFGWSVGFSFSRIPSPNKR